MQTSSLWHSLRRSLLIQRVYCLSPFHLKDNRKLQSTWTMLAYTGAYLTIYIAIIAISIYHLNIFTYLKQFLPVGFMWIALGGFEFFSTNATFVLVVIVLSAKRSVQMDYLQRLVSVDGRLLRHFEAQTDCRRVESRSNFAWITMSIYYQGLAVVATIVVCRTQLSQLVPIIFAYQLEQATASGLAYMLVNYMLILRARFILVRHIFEEASQEYVVTRIRRQKDAVLRRLAVVYQVFKELCDLVSLFDSAFGLVALIRLAHDFTLLNTQMYLVFWLARDAETASDLWYIGIALVWMLPNVIKIGGTTAAVESTLDEVK